MLGEIVFWGVFGTSVTMIFFPVIFSSLFFKWLNYIVDKSEGDTTSDW